MIFVSLPPPAAAPQPADGQSSPPRESGQAAPDGRLTSDAFFAELAREQHSSWHADALGRFPKERRG